MPKDIPFFVPDIGENDYRAVEEALQRDSECKTKLLEKAFVETTGCTHAISANSGTSALHLAMCAMDLKRGDKIVCSVNAFPSVPEVVRHFDAEPIFVDIDPDDFNIDLDALEKVLENNRSKKLKGVIVNHVGGQPTDLERLYAIAEHYKIKVIEEASDAMGGTYGKAPIGASGADITTFSFAPHMKASVANAGMLLCEDDDLAERARLLRNHAIQTDGWDRYGNLEYMYDVIDIGCKYDLSELDAAYALSQYKKLNGAIAKRAAIAKVYMEAFANLKHVIPPVKKREHTLHHFIIKIDRNRDVFAKALKERGVHCGLHYIPLHILTYYKNKYGFKINDFPVALQTYQQVLSLPIYHNMSDQQVQTVIESVREVAQAHI